MLTLGLEWWICRAVNTDIDRIKFQSTWRKLDRMIICFKLKAIPSIHRCFQIGRIFQETSLENVVILWKLHCSLAKRGDIGKSNGFMAQHKIFQNSHCFPCKTQTPKYWVLILEVIARHFSPPFLTPASRCFKADKLLDSYMSSWPTKLRWNPPNICISYSCPGLWSNLELTSSCILP